MGRISTEQWKVNKNSEIGFDDPSTGVEAENLYDRYKKAYSEISRTEGEIDSKERLIDEVETERRRLIEAARVLKEAGVESEIDQKDSSFDDAIGEVKGQIAMLAEQQKGHETQVKANLWDSSQHYKKHAEEYQIAAVNEAALKGIMINTTVDGSPVIPVEAAIKDATDEARITVDYAGKEHKPPIVWR